LKQNDAPDLTPSLPLAACCTAARREITAVSWNVTWLGLMHFKKPSLVAEAFAKVAAIKELVDQHGIVCLQELTGPEPACDLEKFLRKKLRLKVGQHAVICNQEDYCDTSRRLAIIVDLKSLGLTAANIIPIRVKPARMGTLAFSASPLYDCPKFVGALIQTAGHQLLGWAISIGRPAKEAGLQIRLNTSAS
jgi:hypothetical protein